ncbi:unnamed protein product [Cylicocyclus nassatus]|uniref:Histone deacetylase domain-containing protein n=1 Tax=Cylicocyclus nassatus TaxID=53992 RepID=A0AA36H290_CYLNA|nr:unnamed protein product [Cylicocyclus nassatus]
MINANNNKDTRRDSKAWTRHEVSRYGCPQESDESYSSSEETICNFQAEVSMDNHGSLEYKTTLGFNKPQQLHRNPIYDEHPENPSRIDVCRNFLVETGLIKECQEIDTFPSLDDLDLRQTHAEGHVNRLLKEAISMDQESLNHLCEDYDSVFMTPGSIEAAKSAVSCCRWLAESIVEDKIPNAFALVRPPGHHADRYSACGFCLFNNAAQAAEAASNFGADRILIVDLDIHHGQGTQQIFYDDKRVMVFSIHRYDDGRFWPHLRESNFDYIGESEGIGYNVNITLNEPNCGDADYMAILWNVLMPLAREFAPDFVIISAGYDSCDGDPLGGMRLSPDGYSHIIYHLSSLARGKVLLLLEGGYNHSVQSVGVHRCLRVLCGYKPLPITLSIPAKASTVVSCLNVISLLRGFWTCFDYYISTHSKSKHWTLHHPTVIYDPPKEEEKENTGNIVQENLVKYEWATLAPSPSKMLLVHNGDTSKHFSTVEDDHPEVPARTQMILAKLESSGLTSKCEVLLNERFASESELEAVHERPYIQKMRRTTEMTDAELRTTEEGLNSIYLTRDSFPIACGSAGAVLECVDRVLTSWIGEWNAFALVRPPGHHAGISEPSGFCIFNNVAVAAQYALDKYDLQRVLILDWDVHHGNGTQEIFWEDNRVLYMSFHRHDDGTFYPMGEPKNFLDAGEGKGKGFSVNIPWNSCKIGDDAYRAAFTKIIMPIAYEFRPELVFVSSGFDAATGDPLGECFVNPDTYALMTYHLMGLAGGRLITVLEGGYNLDSISDCAAAVCQTMIEGSLRHSYTAKSEGTPQKKRLQCKVWESIRGVAAVQDHYWTCLRGFQKCFPQKMLRSQKLKHDRRSDQMLEAPTSTSPRRSPRLAAMAAIEKQLENLKLS